MLLAAVALAAVLPASGSAAPGCEPHSLDRASTHQWEAPLARTIRVQARDVTLKDALIRLASTAGVRLSYSADLLPLGRRVCVNFKDVPVGDALTDLLHGVAMTAVIAGADHIVLTPSDVRGELDAGATPTPLYPLPPVFATASAQAPLMHERNYATDVLGARQVAQQGTIGDAINAGVPGVWTWQSPNGFLALTSARGASSFGITTRKVYIDGIEVANPLLAAQIAPENIERIEIIRGPQGAALYGSGALNGVTNIVTRHNWADAGVPRLRVRTGVGLSASDFAGRATVGQDHALAMQFGSRTRSANANFGLGTLGEYIPNAYMRHVSGDASVRLLGKRTLLTGTVRAFSQSSGNPAGLMVDPAVRSITPLSVRQYTAGIKGEFRPNDAITHSLVVGLDGYTLGNETADSIVPLSTADSILRAWDGGVRTTLRLTTVARLTQSDAARTTLTLSAEHTGLHQHGGGVSATYGSSYGTVADYTDPPAGGDYGSVPGDSGSATHRYAAETYDQVRSANGISAQVEATLRDRLSLNAGVRLERDKVNGAGEGAATLPMAGAAYAMGGSDFRARVRTAYGKAVRWPEMRGLDQPTYQRAYRPALAPEQQAGVEVGIDVSFRDVVGLQVTRYDQMASGLRQLVALAPTTEQPWVRYEFQNVGEIANRGWEMQAYLRHGPVSLSGTLALTSSRVSSLAEGYTGDLQAGDRMLGVPARTMSLNASWTAGDWSASTTIARAFDWMNYDRAGLALLATQPICTELRDYWAHYDGVTHLRATLSRNLPYGFTALLTGDNLLDKQVGEPDNLTAVPGRTISLGLRAAF